MAEHLDKPAYDWRKYCAGKYIFDPIAKEDLVDGAYYLGTCRNACVARWFANEQVFKYWRNKFGYFRIEEIRHPQDESYFDVFIPIKQAGEHDITMLHDEIT